MIRISRPCYDKMHRCPGWSGGGIHSAKVDRCEGGYIRYYTDGEHEKRLWKWRLNRCPKCGVVVLPYVVRYVDWGWYTWQKERAVRAVATLYFHVPPLWLNGWLGRHLPGFTDSYDDVYDDWERKQARRERTPVRDLEPIDPEEAQAALDEAAERGDPGAVELKRMLGKGEEQR